MGAVDLHRGPSHVQRQPELIMKTDTDLEKKTVATTPARDIPPPPGGGQWRFDDVRWEWIDLNPQPEPAAQLNQE